MAKLGRQYRENKDDLARVRTCTEYLNKASFIPEASDQDVVGACVALVFSDKTPCEIVESLKDLIKATLPEVARAHE